MRTLRLPSGRIVEVFLQHAIRDLEEGPLGFDTHGYNAERRVCMITVSPVEDTEEWGTTESVAICRPPDNYNRKVGRRIAARKLIKALKEDGYTDDDRIAIFYELCPEFGQTTAERIHLNIPPVP